MLFYVARHVLARRRSMTKSNTTIRGERANESLHTCCSTIDNGGSVDARGSSNPKSRQRQQLSTVVALIFINPDRSDKAAATPRSQHFHCHHRISQSSQSSEHQSFTEQKATAYQSVHDNLHSYHAIFRSNNSIAALHHTTNINIGLSGC